MAQHDQIDELLDARAELRRLRIELTEKRITLHQSIPFKAYQRVKEELRATSDAFEECLTELEQKQGRLPFMEEAAPSVPIGSNGRKPRKVRDAEGPRA
jgi:hypothetical protein